MHGGGSKEAFPYSAPSKGYGAAWRPPTFRKPGDRAPVPGFLALSKLPLKPTPEEKYIWNQMDLGSNLSLTPY